MKIASLFFTAVLCCSVAGAQSRKDRERLELAFDFYENREEDFALAAVDELIEKHPRKMELRMVRAQWLADFARFDEAAEDYRDIFGMKLDETYLFRTNYAYANVLLCQGKTDEAAEWVKSSLTDSTSEEYQLQSVAYILYLCEKYEEALGWFLRARKHFPEVSFPTYFAGASLLKLKRPDEANQYLEEAIRLENQSGISYLKPYAYILTGDVDKGIAEIEKSLLHPHIVTLGNAPSIYCLAGREKDSMNAFEKFWEHRDLYYYAYLKSSHDLDCLRKNEKFLEYYRMIFP